MFGLANIDIIIIVIYFLILVGIGFRASRRIHVQEDYLLAGRRFGKLIQTFASFGQATSADGPVGVATTTFRNGAGGIWSSLLMVFFTPIYWITSPWLRRLRILTMGDFYAERYGSKKMATVYAIIGSIGMMGLLSVGYTAMNISIVAMTPKTVAQYTPEEKTEYALGIELSELENRNFTSLTSQETDRLNELRELQPRSHFSHINEDILIWIVCFIVMIYAMAGGLEAAFLSDMLQGFFIIILSIILIPFSWAKINTIYGGTSITDALKNLHERLPESFFETFGSPTAMDFTWYFIITVSVVAGITVVTQPNQLVTNAAAKDEYSARVGFVTGTFMKRFCTILWGMLGLSAILLYTGKIQNSDLIWGTATRDLLGSFKIGLVGLMIASMMAALMSTADALMLTVSGLWMHNVYHPLVQGKSEDHYLWASRVLGGFFLICAAVIATQFDSILEILKFIWEFFVIFAPAFWLGIKWRRPSRQAAWWSILSTFVLFYFIPVLLPVLFSGLRSNPTLTKQTKHIIIERTYTAREMDIEERNLEITRWDQLNAENKTVDNRPDSIFPGQKFTKDFVLPAKSIYWSKSVKRNNEGELQGRGYIYLELLLLDTLGTDLSSNPYALNETIRMSVRLVFPFLVLIFVAFLTKPEDKEMLDRFFIKMRTKVRGGGATADNKELGKAFAKPADTEKILLFPGTNLEIYKWNRQDLIGFMVSVVVVFIVLLCLHLAVSIGG